MNIGIVDIRLYPEKSLKNTTQNIFYISFVSSTLICIIVCFEKYCNGGAVTGRTRRETCGSICKALFQNMVIIQAGSINSKQVWQGQDTE